MTRHIFGIIALFSLAATSSFAKWSDIEAMTPDAPILVHSGFITDAGTFVSATADTVVVDVRTGMVTVKKENIDDVYIIQSRGARAKQALLWGGLAAGVTAGAFFPLAAQLARPSYIQPALLTAGMGTSFGLMRYTRVRTKRIYKRD